MIDELIVIEQLERIQRLIEGGNTELALNHIKTILKDRKQRVVEIEREFDNYPV